MKKNKMDDRLAVLLTWYDEKQKPDYPGKAAVLAACDLFLAITEWPCLPANNTRH